VKFSFDRVININDASGPASLLGNLDSIATPDDLTVEFTLKEGPDLTFLQVLATNAGPIVDEEVLDPNALTPDEDIVAADAFSGPYTISSYTKNETMELTPNATYNGANPPAANAGVIYQVFADDVSLMQSVSNGDIDVAYRSLNPTQIESMQGDSNVTVWNDKGGEIRYIVFNFNTMPGETPEGRFAVRQAMASLIDREALANDVYKGQYLPLCSYVPDGMPGATTSVCDTYPLDADAAAAYLSDAGIATPVDIHIQWNPDHYGSASGDEYGLIAQQLEDSGLFTVTLDSTEWTTYSAERTEDLYPIYQLGWFPDFPDPDNYLNPFFNANNFLGNHFQSDNIEGLIISQFTDTNPTTRMATIGQIQDVMAQEYLSSLPLLQGSQWAFSGTDIQGIELGPSDNLHFWTITKG
jgi:peptide/nickel transport system substrate-binding protein